MKRSILRDCVNFAKSKFGPTHPSWNFKSIHFSSIVQNNKILGHGVNRPANVIPVYYGYTNMFIHSEIDVWRRVRGILEDGEWEIVNIRLTKEEDGRLAYSAPCETCLNFLASNGCSKIWFSTGDKKRQFAYVIVGG